MVTKRTLGSPSNPPRSASSGSRSTKFFFQAENDGTAPDDLRVKGSRKNRKVTVRYFRTSRPKANVTADMIRDGLVISGLGSGRSIRFKGKAAAGEAGLARSLSRRLKVMTWSKSGGSPDKAKIEVTTSP